MKALTRSFLRSKFMDYYRTSSLDLPPGLEEREWGFILFDDIGMRRHKSYVTPGELSGYVRSMVPVHLYHSAAYYSRPGAPSMKEKGWKGADLIFDLDADHLRGAPKTYGDMLSMVKRETRKLLDFLLGDFGFPEERVRVVFSGGRGYHIHIRDPSVFGFRGDERREIVDYLTGRGLDVERLTTRVLVTGDVGAKGVRSLRCPPEGSPGWAGRFNRAATQFIAGISRLEEEMAVKELTRIKGIGKTKAIEFYKYVREPATLDDVRRGNLDTRKAVSGIWVPVMEYVADQAVQGLGGETDEPVTADVKRLIRCPGSLHGGSGFRVTPLTIQELEEFDPLWDAVVFEDSPVRVEVTKPFSTEVRGETYSLQPGTAELPLAAAVFLMARGAAELGRASER